MILFWTHWTIGWTALAVLTFVVLLFRTAPYGRHTTTSTGPTLPHRMGWIVMETVSPLMLVWVAWRTSAGDLTNWSAGQQALLLAWIGHYVYRAWAYPFLARWKNRRMPVLIMVSAVGFNLVNGSLNGFELAVRPALEMGSTGFVAGALLFGAGLALNVHSDFLLRRLRKPGETGYQIPERGAFRWVSCPNYLGEILEWTGFAIMAATPAAFSFAVWTAANLIPRALSHHRWYQNRFAMYPRQRKAVIPFIL